MSSTIADDARPEAEVVEEVRQMVCDNFDDVMEVHIHNKTDVSQAVYLEK